MVSYYKASNNSNKILKLNKFVLLICFQFTYYIIKRLLHIRLLRKIIPLASRRKGWKNQLSHEANTNTPFLILFCLMPK